MKILRFVLLMVIAEVSLQGVGFAGPSSPASQQAPSQGSDKAAEQQINDARNGTGLARPGEPHQNQKRPARQTNTTNHRLSVNNSKVRSPHQARLEKTMGLQQTRSGGATPVSGKTASHRSPPVPTAAVSVNGQHFRSSRDPGARLAVTGGPSTATRDTGVIDGTKMRRKF